MSIKPRDLSLTPTPTPILLPKTTRSKMNGSTQIVFLDRPRLLKSVTYNLLRWRLRSDLLLEAHLRK